MSQARSSPAVMGGFLLAAGAGYALLTALGMGMFPASGVAELWPAGGFAAVMVLWAGTPARRAATLAAMLLGYLAVMSLGSPFQPLVPVFAVANMLEAVVVLPFLVRATHTDQRLTNSASLHWLLGGCVAGPAVAATVAALGAWWVGVGDQPWTYWWTWWVGDALGILVMAPVLLQVRPPAALWARGGVGEQVAVWAAFALALASVARYPDVPAGIPLAALTGATVLVALRLSSAAASAAVLVASLALALLPVGAQQLVVLESSGPGAWYDDVRAMTLLLAVTAQAVSLSTTARISALAEREAALARAREEALRAEGSDQTLRSALNASLDGFAVCRPGNPCWEVVFANSVAQRAAGATRARAGADHPDREELAPPHTLADLLGPDVVVPVSALLASAVRTGRPQQMAVMMARPSGHDLGDFQVVAAPAGSDVAVLNWRDVTVEHETERQLRAAHAAAMHAATHDPLTNLPNRVLLDDRLAHAIASLRRRGDALGVLLLDLDDFKDANDRFGHIAGDALLIEVARRLERMVRANDTVSRLGGDEFVLVLTGIDETWSAESYFTRLREAICQPFEWSGNSMGVGLSAGYLVVTDPQMDPEEVIARVDAALYRSKAGGKGRITAFTSALTHASRWLPRPADLRAALDRGEFALAYQPVVDLHSGQVVGQEALVRWRHPGHGLLGPERFLGLAESSGLMTDLGTWVLERALADFGHWEEPTWISVNIATAQLIRRDIRADVTRALQRTGVDPHRLVVELTERQLIRATPTILGQLEALRALGVSIALDDFGSGYSALAYLQALPLDIVKLDREFLATGVDERARSFLTWLAGMSPAFARTTIIEGIETAEHRDLARDAGIALGQGYLLGRPVLLG